MTELFINNERVILPKSTSVKVVSENPYFTRSGKYTLDIEIPLQGNIQNGKTFRHINRMDVGKDVESISARIVADNKVVIDGTATITSITETSVKIQILSGNAEMNFKSKFEKLYVDELDLGRITYEIKYSDGTNPDGVKYDMSKMPEADRYKFAFGLYGETDYVCFPIYNESEDKIYNNHCVRVTGKDTYTVFFPHSFYGSAYPIDDMTTCGGHYVPQPYFCFILRKVFNALGYDVVLNQIEETPLKNAFICNTRFTLKLNEMLPHWTVSDFIDQVERFFGVVVRIGENNKTVSVLGRDVYYKASEVYIGEVKSEYSVSCDREETTDISNGNVGYEFSVVDPYLKIDKELVDKAEKKAFASNTELQSYYNGLSAADKAKYLYETGGRQYIHYTESKTSYLLEVNQFRDLIRNPESDGADIELKIVPVRMKIGKVRWESYKYDDFFKKYYPQEGVQVDAVMIHVAGDEQYADAAFDFQAAIDGEISTEATKDKLELAMNDAKFQTVKTDDGKSTYKFPWPFVLTKDLLYGDVNRGFSFELNNVTGRTTMYNTVFGTKTKVNTQSELYIKFLTDKMFDPMQRFIINNKQYLCKQLEYQVDAQGILKEKSGYFYEYQD